MTGQSILHYRILRKLGGGGMGVVYEAEDTKLGRRVALKFLPEDSLASPQTLERFQREARSASALNHPNICTIYAIEENNGKMFIAMELLEGESLDKTLPAGALPIPRIVEIGIQLTDALDAAHKKGIVHRDIKPSNIMVTGRGVVKILDFGLAKILDDDRDAHLGGETVGDTAAALLTSPGTSVGTIAYMSPEQARGEELDGRSDLFSLGAVLYQMVTGRHPFPGNTSAVVFDNILRNSPVPIAGLNPPVPPELDRLINKALEKDRDVRYQVASEMRADLKRLQRESDSGRVVSSSSRVPSSATASGVAAIATPTPDPASAAQIKSPSGSSAIIQAASKNKLGAGLTLALAAVVLVAAAFGIYSLALRSHHLPFEKFSIENLTNNGHVSLSAISPDGKYLLHAREENGLQSLWLRHIPTGSNTQVVAPAATRYDGLTFSPDGNYIYFVRRDEDEHTISILYRAPMLGGSPGVLIRDVDSPATFSPDGQRLAFLRERHDSPFFDLLITNSDGTGEHALFSSKPLATDSSVAAWSPDGKTLAIPIVQPTKTDLGAFLMVDTATGKESTAGITKTSIFHSPVWMPDGRGLIFSVVQPQVGKLQLQLGYLAYPQGEMRALTSDTNNYVSPSVAADGKSLVATQVQVREQLSIAPASAPSEWHPLQLMSDQLIWRWDWTPDGRLLLPQAGDIRLVSPAGGEKVVFSDRAHIADQVTSCDAGHLIVFRQIGRSGNAATNLWRMDEDGGNEKQLTFGLNESEPKCASDRKWLYFLDHEDHRYVKRIPLAGGSPEIVVNTPVGIFDLSSDGKRVLSSEVREEDHKLVTRIDSVDDHKMQYFDIDQRALPGVQFTPDGKGLVFVVREKGVDNLWTQSFDGSPARQLTHFNADQIYSFMYSRDASQLAVERGHVESDAILLRDTSGQ